MRKPISRIVLIVILIAIFVLVAGLFFYIRNICTSDSLSMTFSRSASNSPLTEDRIYIKDNVLYFVEQHAQTSNIRYVKNGVTRTYAKLPELCERFIILDDGSVIFQNNNSINRFNVSDSTVVELWQGNNVGSYGDQIYFTNDTTLYAAKVEALEPQSIVSFDELLAFYDDGIIYKTEDGVYQLLWERSTSPQQLMTGDINWLDNKGVWLLDETYLYTSDYALRISGRAIDMYIYETDTMQRIYEINDNMATMAVTARDNELYVSRQYMDLKFWPIKDKKINGTYKFDIQSSEWTKITDKTYPVIKQFDEGHLYGINPDNSYGMIKKVSLN